MLPSSSSLPAAALLALTPPLSAISLSLPLLACLLACCREGGREGESGAPAGPGPWLRRRRWRWLPWWSVGRSVGHATGTAGDAAAAHGRVMVSLRFRVRRSGDPLLVFCLSIWLARLGFPCLLAGWLPRRGDRYFSLSFSSSSPHFFLSFSLPKKQ